MPVRIKYKGVSKMEFNEVIRSRRSIRRFKSEPISDEQIKELMEAARLAPSGLNLQPWRYVIVKDKAVRESISKAVPSAHVAQAPLIIVCCMDTKNFESTGARVQELHEAGAMANTSFSSYSSDDFFAGKNIDEFWIKSNLMLNTAISVEHIVLKAADLGLGSCWIGIFDKDGIKKAIGIDDRYDVFALLPIGYPDQDVKPRPRLSIDEIILKEL